jgi:hypothetical protein
MTPAERTVLQSEIASLSRSELAADHALAIEMFAKAPAETVEDWRETAMMYAREIVAREPIWTWVNAKLMKAG